MNRMEQALARAGGARVADDRASQALTELADVDLDRVAGGGCWMQVVIGHSVKWHQHNGYPPEL